MHTHNFSPWTHNHIFDKGRWWIGRADFLAPADPLSGGASRRRGRSAGQHCVRDDSRRRAHHHDHHGEHAHDGDHQHHAHHHDLNLKSAYLHVIADAATSLLAIVALAGGWLYGPG